MRILLAIALVLFVGACQQKSPVKNGEEKSTYIKKNYYENGALMSKVPVVDDAIHGTVRNYYKSGKLHSEVFYDHGKKTKTIWYYESGEVYRITPYKNNKVHGTRKFFFRDSTLKAEVPYVNGEPVEGLKEYTSSGTLVKDYPKIRFKKINKLEENKIILRINLSNYSPNVEYYQLIRSNGKTHKKEIPSNEGAAQLTFKLSPGYEIDNKKISVYAETNSGRGNPYVTHADYYLNAVNPK
jgi:antitoxin component YwqK of YwqJK toxin-antitoxin module